MRLLPLMIVLVGCPAPVDPTDTDPDSGTDTDTDTADPGVTVRVVTWNIEGVGTASSTEGKAERAILARLDADVVGLNEVDEGEAGRLADLASDLGYDVYFTPQSNPFGTLRNGMMTRLPVVEIGALSPAELSGDRDANDATRHPVRVIVEVPGTGQRLTVVSNHWKSGFDPSDRFRRTVDGIRTAQAAGDTFALAMGDVNAELEDMPESPATWSSVPDGLPFDYRLGDDARGTLQATGLTNSAFGAFDDAGMHVVEALQIDGRLATRPSSGRAIDWIYATADLDGAIVGEIYDCTDEGQGEGLPKAGEPPARSACTDASDHLPVFVDVTFR